AGEIDISATAVRTLEYIPSSDVDGIGIGRANRDVAVVAELSGIERRGAPVRPGQSTIAAAFDADVELTHKLSASINVKDLWIGGGNSDSDVLREEGIVEYRIQWRPGFSPIGRTVDARGIGQRHGDR